MHSLQLKSKRTQRWLSICLLMLTAAATAQAAGRHLKLIKSTPAHAATLARAPERVLLTFSQKPNLQLTRVAVTDQRGAEVPVKAPVSADTSGRAVAVQLPSLAPGTYHVSWRTLARDGHKVAGRLSFTIDSEAGRRAVSLRR